MIETEVKNVKQGMTEMDRRIKEDMEEIKRVLKEHVEVQRIQFENLEKRFASKWVEKAFLSLALGLALAVLGMVLGKL